MGNFEKLSVLVIVVIIVMILVVALYTWSDDGEGSAALAGDTIAVVPKSADPDQIPELPIKSDFSWPVPPVKPGEDIEHLGDVGDVGENAVGDVLEEEDVDHSEPRPDPEPIQGGNWTYTIKQGDTLGLVSQNELGTVHRLQEILDLNPGIDPLRIRPGQELQMPPKTLATIPGVIGPDGDDPHQATVIPGPSGGKITTGEHYVTKTGDTIQSIAKRAYGNHERWPELWARNLSAVPSIDAAIPVGTRIFIPK